jgi:site-specific DNA-methyltransferase (adenine-specific)
VGSIVFNSDCVEGMKQFPDKYFDLAVVDPPYQGNDAIGLINGNGHAANRTKYHVFENVKPDENYFNELRRVSKNQIVWGGNFFGLSGGVIAWNKNGTAFGEGEIAICSTHKSVRFFEYTWNGMIQGDMKNKEIRFHPTQKPIALYDWIYKNYAEEGMKVIDTHLGSGSNRISAHKYKMDFTAFEIDKEYFDKQEQRYRDFISQTTLF